MTAAIIIKQAAPTYRNGFCGAVHVERRASVQHDRVGYWPRHLPAQHLFQNLGIHHTVTAFEIFDGALLKAEFEGVNGAGYHTRGCDPSHVGHRDRCELVEA